MGRSWPFKMVDIFPVQSPIRKALSWLGVCTRVAHMGRWTGVNYHHHLIIHPLSVPGTTQKADTWVPFLTWSHLERDTGVLALYLPKGSRCQWYSACCPITFLLHFEQALLVAGGRDSSNDLLSSTELYLPSANGWTRKTNLPRQQKIKLLWLWLQLS